MKMYYKSKLFTILIPIALITIIAGKLWFNTNTQNLLMYVYGVLVTAVLLTTFVVAFFIYKDPYIEAEKKLKLLGEVVNYGPMVTCLVPVYNERENIDKCIDSLINQTYKNKEIIIVNDASTDGTKEILFQYARKGLIKVIHLTKNVMKKRAIGKGMLQAKGKIFVFTDSDCILAPDAVSKTVAILRANPEVGGVSGHSRVLNVDKSIYTKIQDPWYDGQYGVRKAFESVFGAVTCVSGPLAVFKKEAIFNFIPAWENDEFLGQEFKFATDRTLTGFVLGGKVVGQKFKDKYADSPFIKRHDYPLVDWKIVYTKSARAWTIVPDTFKRMLKQQIRWKKSFIRNLFFTGTFYWRKPFIPAIVYYLHILFVIMGPFIVFRHLIYIPIRGDWYSAFLYLAGISFIGFCFGIAYKIENRDCHRWVYRPCMSLLSTLCLSCLVFYSALTIRKMVWTRG